MQPRRLSRAIACLLAGALSLPSATVWAGPADELSDLVGAKGAGGEADLERRGYTHIDTHKSTNSAYGYWWSNAKSSCIRVTTRDGRYQALTDADPSDCGQTKKESGMSDGAKVAVGAAALLGIAALAHKSHQRDDRNFNEQQTADFERGYRDGLYNNSFSNRSGSGSGEYRDGCALWIPLVFWGDARSRRHRPVVRARGRLSPVGTHVRRRGARRARRHLRARLAAAPLRS